MKADLQKIITKFKSFGRLIVKYSGFIVILLALCAYGFIVYRIGALTNKEPNEDEVASQLDTLKKPTVDQNTINKIQQLEDSNVQVKTLFDQARDNPFQD